jgi:hypothetical protein
MRSVIGLAAAMVLAGTLTAAATIEWWTPTEKDCPSFATEAACTAFCAQDPQRCGGSTSCVQHSGPVAPGC